MSETLDVAIIGAGTAGLSALREVRKLRSALRALASQLPAREESDLAACGSLGAEALD